MFPSSQQGWVYNNPSPSGGATLLSWITVSPVPPTGWVLCPPTPCWLSQRALTESWDAVMAGGQHFWACTAKQSQSHGHRIRDFPRGPRQLGFPFPTTSSSTPHCFIYWVSQTGNLNERLRLYKKSLFYIPLRFSFKKPPREPHNPVSMCTG